MRYLVMLLDGLIIPVAGHGISGHATGWSSLGNKFHGWM